MDKELSFGILIILIGLVFGQNCNKVTELNECLREFTAEFTELQEKLGTPGGPSSFCSEKENPVSRLKECQEGVIDEDDQGCVQHAAREKMAADQLSENYDKILCDPDNECSILRTYQCYEDILKGLGIESLETLEDLASLMKLQYMDPKTIDHETFCKHFVDADWDEMNECAEERAQEMSKCVPGAGGPEGGSPIAGFALDLEAFANLTVICEPGCENFFKTQDHIRSFDIEDTIQEAISAENGTDEFTEACGKLKDALEEGTTLAAGCEVQEVAITQAVESDQELVDAMENCGLTLEFKSDATTMFLSVHALLFGILVLML